MDDQQYQISQARLHEMQKVTAETHEFGVSAAAVSQVGMVNPLSQTGFPTSKDRIDQTRATPRVVQVQAIVPCARSIRIPQEPKTAHRATHGPQKVVLFPGQ